MKEFIFRVWDINSNYEEIYKILAETTEEAKTLFMNKCIPLFCTEFNYEDMVEMFSSYNMEIEFFELTNAKML